MARSYFCVMCGYSPIIVMNGPLTWESIDRVKICCFNCGLIYKSRDKEILLGKNRARN